MTVDGEGELVSGGFQVVMARLQAGAQAFGSESGTLAAIMPESGPPAVDGGSAAFDTALSVVLEAIGGLHAQLAAVVGQDGDKLSAACQTYKRADDAGVRLSQGVLATMP